MKKYYSEEQVVALLTEQKKIILKRWDLGLGKELGIMRVIIDAPSPKLTGGFKLPLKKEIHFAAINCSPSNEGRNTFKAGVKWFKSKLGIIEE